MSTNLSSDVARTNLRSLWRTWNLPLRDGSKGGGWPPRGAFAIADGGSRSTHSSKPSATLPPCSWSMIREGWLQSFLRLVMDARTSV